MKFFNESFIIFYLINVQWHLKHLSLLPLSSGMQGKLTVGGLKERRSETLGEELQNTQQQLEGYHKVILHLQKCSFTGNMTQKHVKMWA